MIHCLHRDDVVYLEGELDHASVADLRLGLIGALDVTSARTLVVDVSGLRLCDATGLGALLGAHRRAIRAGRELRVRGARGELRRILRLTRLDAVLNLERGEPLPV